MTYPVPVSSHELTCELEDDLPDMFAELPPADPFLLKKDEIAAALNALLIFSGGNRSELAERLNCNKSRVTNILSGKANLTLNTLWEFSSCLGYDFDVVFRAFKQKRALQPWQKASALPVIVEAKISNSKGIKPITVIVQTANEVARDMARGSHKSMYVSFCNLGDENQTALSVIDVAPTQKIPQSKLNFEIPRREKLNVR